MCLPYLATPGALFQLLMEMVTEPIPPEDPVAMQLSSVASACLLSLVVALGDTGKMLAALAAMLTAPPPLSETQVKVRCWRERKGGVLLSGIT